MCLAVPGRVLEIFEENGLKMGKIDYAGAVNLACLEYVPEVLVDDFVIVHAGFAISVLDEDEAQRTFDAWAELIAASEDEDPVMDTPEPRFLQGKGEGEP